jgi:hypothetical protein
MSVGLLLAAGVTARPVPEPFSISGLWGELTNGVGDIIDKTKNALFPSKISGSTYTLYQRHKHSHSTAGKTNITDIYVNRRTALSPSLLPEFTYFAEFSAAAYCDPNHVPNTEVKCGKNICPTIEKNNVTTIIEFSEYVPLSSNNHNANILPEALLAQPASLPATTPQRP